MIPYAQIAAYSQIKEISVKKNNYIEKTEECKRDCQINHIYREGFTNIFECYEKCKKKE